MDGTNDKTTLELMGMACANSLLENSIEWLNTFGENDFLNGGKLSQQASSFLVIGHAIIQQQERLAVVKNEHLEALKDGIDSLNNNLENVKDSINDLGSYFGTLDENLIWLGGIKEQLEYVVESIDCAGAKPTELWMQSGLAANAMAKSLGIDTRACETFDDVRYLIAKELAENADGAVV